MNEREINRESVRVSIRAYLFSFLGWLEKENELCVMSGRSTAPASSGSFGEVTNAI